MSECRINWSEARLDARLSVSSMAGTASGWEDAGKFLKLTAGERFANGQDNEARLLRELSQECAAKAETWRSLQREQEARLKTLETEDA